MKKKPGFTLLELLLVMVIVGITAGIAIYSYPSFAERNIGKEAEVSLKLIYHAQKRHAFDNHGTYFSCAPHCTTELINSNLGIELRQANFTYSIAWRDPSAKAGFIAEATRKSKGSCANKKMILTDLGGQPEKRCAQW